MGGCKSSISSSNNTKHNGSENEVDRHNVPIVSSINDRIRPLLDAVDKLRHLKIMKEVDRHNVPIVSSINDRIRPLLDAVDKLRHLNIMKEGIQLPTIVVVGDQSSGKSSVLESLAGINLPRGQGICTRVPLIMRLQHHPSPKPELFLEFNGKTVHTDEDRIEEDITCSTDEIAGDGKGISNVPLTLTVKRSGVPDITMVDLPGITRVAVRGQPENIYEQIKEIIMEYIRPEESIILNVLSASVDFTTCESIRMSQEVDKTGERTLAVVTKCDKAPEGLLEKVTADDVNIGLGYVCVRNRIGDESYEEARKEEATLFTTHPFLSEISKSMVGIPVLAEKLVQVQASIISKCLPEIVRKISDKLNASMSELNKMPRVMASDAEAITTLVGVIGSAKESLRKLLLRGEYDEYPDDPNMHCTARLFQMLNQYSAELHNCPESEPKKNFLTEEIQVLEEAKGIGLPNFVPRSAFLAILGPKVAGISQIPAGFVEKLWSYIEGVIMSVLKRHSENYSQIQMSTKRAGNNLIAKMKERSLNWVEEMVQMEALTGYTCNPDYMNEWNKLVAQQSTVIDDILQYSYTHARIIEGVGQVTVDDLRSYEHVLSQAFDLKMRMVAYWKVVLMRLVDSMALHIQHSVRNLVDKELEKEIMSDLMGHGGGIEKMLEESPSVAVRREKLTASVKLLKESKVVLANIMDNISINRD